MISQATRCSDTPHSLPDASATRLPGGSVPRLSALTPQHAIGLLRLLSTDLRAVAVLDASGGLLAGDAELAGALPAAGPGSWREADLLVVRDERHAVAVRTGPHVLDGLLVGDLRAVLGDLG